MFRRTIAIPLILLFSISLMSIVGCGGDKETTTTEKTVEKDTTTTQSVTPPALTWQTIIDVTANTDKRTESFHLGSGQKRLLYNVTGSDLVCLIYVVKEGSTPEAEGGDPEVGVSEQGPGETALVREPGNYYLEVFADRCTWQVTIQELK